MAEGDQSTLKSVSWVGVARSTASNTAPSLLSITRGIIMSSRRDIARCCYCGSERACRGILQQHARMMQSLASSPARTNYTILSQIKPIFARSAQSRCLGGGAVRPARNAFRINAVLGQRAADPPARPPAGASCGWP